MGTEYDIVSDATREGYELGKGPWYRLAEALRSPDPTSSVATLMLEEFRDPKYVADIVKEVVAFAESHPDWRVIDDCSSDISVMTDEERDQMRAEDIACGDDPDEFEDDIYKKVGSRYRDDVPAEEEPLAIDPDHMKGYMKSPAELRHEEELTRKGIPVLTRAELSTNFKKMLEGQREAQARRRDMRAVFGPSTVEPGARLTMTIVGGTLAWYSGNRRQMRSVSKEELVEIEVFRPCEFVVKIEGADDVIVEAVNIGGTNQLVGPASSLLFTSSAGSLIVDSGPPDTIEVVLFNPHDKPCKVSLEMRGAAMVKKGSG